MLGLRVAHTSGVDEHRKAVPQVNAPARLFDVPEAEKVASGLFTSLTCEWPTPQALYDELDAEFHFTLDPCATDENHKAPRYFTRSEDGLMRSWEGERVYMNPPYGSELPKWIAKAHSEAQRGTLVVALIPSRTDTRWWHDCCMKASEIRFIKGRVKFGDATTGAPFPSAIVIWNGVDAI